MRRKTLIATALAALGGPALADAPAATAGYALADGGRALVVMADLAAPRKARTLPLAKPLAAIAWRPVTGELLGFARDAIVTIDPATGALSDLGATFAEGTTIAAGAMVGLDFNNAIDAVRAVTTDGDNLVYFPAGFGEGDERADSVRRFTNLAFAEGDASAGAEPVVFANAYTNAIPGRTASATFQYALDAGSNALVSLANNAGTLETVGPVTVDGAPVDIAPMGGFDIVSPREGEDHAFAILQIEGEATAGLYAIDLASGAATLIAGLGEGGFTGFAASSGM